MAERPSGPEATLDLMVASPRKTSMDEMSTEDSAGETAAAGGRAEVSTLSVE